MRFYLTCRIGLIHKSVGWLIGLFYGMSTLDRLFYAEVSLCGKQLSGFK